MRVDRVVPNLTVADLRTAVAEHSEVLGLRVLMDHGWIVTLGGDDGHQLSVMTEDASAPVNPDVSVFVDDVGEAFARDNCGTRDHPSAHRRTLGCHPILLPGVGRSGDQRRHAHSVTASPVISRDPKNLYIHREPNVWDFARSSG